MSTFKHWSEIDVERFNVKHKPQTAPAAASKPAEKEVGGGGLHEEFEKWLKSLGKRCYWLHSRTDRKATVKSGTPDFVGWIDGAAWGVELKSAGKKVRPEQLGELLRCELAGATAGAAWDLEAAKAIVQSAFWARWHEKL